MGSLNQLWNVEIRLGTLSINERSFSDFLILGAHINSLARAFVITDADQLLDMGFSPLDPIYEAAADAFGQTPAVNQVYIGRKLVDAASLVIDTVSDNTEYSLEFSWVDAGNEAHTETISFTSSTGATATAIATGLKSAITAGQVGGVLTPTTSAGKLTLTAATTGQRWTVNPGANISVDTSSFVISETTADTLAAVEAGTGWWYGLILTTTNKAEVKAAADWVQANEKLLLYGSDDPDILRAASDDSIADYVQNNNYSRTAIMYQSKADDQFPDAALMSDRFTYHPGSETWANVRLESVYADELTATDYIVAKAKNVTTFSRFRNFAITRGGTVATGEWIDIIRFRDYLVEQIKVNETNMLVNMTQTQGKLPYTDSGIQAVVSVLRNTLDREVGMGIARPTIDADTGETIPSYKITYPRASEISANQKASRVLEGVKFTARLAGAIHNGEITGSLTYSF